MRAATTSDEPKTFFSASGSVPRCLVILIQEKSFVRSLLSRIYLFHSTIGWKHAQTLGSSRNPFQPLRLDQNRAHWVVLNQQFTCRKHDHAHRDSDHDCFFYTHGKTAVSLVVMASHEVPSCLALLDNAFSTQIQLPFIAGSHYFNAICFADLYKFP
ncbi:hypothetical protein BRIN106911_01360 [Brevibacillus invocatus]